MLTILLPAWTWWTVGAWVAITWLWAWALCRAADRGDEMIRSLPQDMAGAGPPLTPQRAEAATASAAIGFGESEVHGFFEDDFNDFFENDFNDFVENDFKDFVEDDFDDAIERLVTTGPTRDQPWSHSYQELTELQTS